MLQSTLVEEHLNRKGKYALETYEISNGNTELIKLLRKKDANKKMIKHFKIENNDVLSIKINFTYYKVKENLLNVQLIDFDRQMDMKLENFKLNNQNDIKLMKYLNNSTFNQFKVKFKDGELFEL